MKKINSKTLIENICKVSSMITRFDNSGRLRFDLIEPAYFIAQNDDGENIYDGDEILAKDVISHSYSRTSIDNIKTRVIVKYDWDYARKEFNKEFDLSSVPNLGDLPYSVSNLSNLSVGTHLLSEYEYSYYGLPQDDSDSTLIIDDDRGKYIKDDQTAKNYAKWLLYWHCNSHLKLKIRLGLKYLWVETGSIVYLDKVISDANPYGIDYSKSAFYSKGGLNFYGTELNGQQVFPQFMVVSSVKNLDYVELELIQMHNLSNWGVEIEAVFGAISLDSEGNEPINFNSDANFSDGSEIYATYTADVGICGLSEPEGTYEDYNYNPYADPTNAEEYEQFEGGYTGDSYSQQDEGDSERDEVQLNMYNYAFYNHNKAIEYFSNEEPDVNQQNSKWYIIASEGNPNGACQLAPDLPDPPPELETLTANFGYLNNEGQEANGYQVTLYPNSNYNIPHTFSESAYNSGNIYFKTSWNINIDPNLPCDSITIQLSLFQNNVFIKDIEYVCDPDSDFNEYLSENLLIDFIPPEFFTDYEYQNNNDFKININYKLGYEGSPNNYNYLGFFNISYEIDEPVDNDVNPADDPDDYTKILEFPIQSDIGGLNSTVTGIEDYAFTNFLFQDKSWGGYTDDLLNKFMNIVNFALGNQDQNSTYQSVDNLYVQFTFNSSVAESGEWTQQEIDEMINIVETKSGICSSTTLGTQYSSDQITCRLHSSFISIQDYPNLLSAAEGQGTLNITDRPSGIPLGLKLWISNDLLSDYYSYKFYYLNRLTSAGKKSGIRITFNKDQNYIEWKWSNETVSFYGSQYAVPDWIEEGHFDWVEGVNPMVRLQEYEGESLPVQFALEDLDVAEIEDIPAYYIIDDLRYCSGDSHTISNVVYETEIVSDETEDRNQINTISFRITPASDTALADYLNNWETLEGFGDTISDFSSDAYRTGASLLDVYIGGTNIMLGDLTGDEIINVLDIVMMVNIILNDSDYNPAGDLTGDGIINVLDIVSMVNIILG